MYSIILVLYNSSTTAVCTCHTAVLFIVGKNPTLFIPHSMNFLLLHCTAVRITLISYGVQNNTVQGYSTEYRTFLLLYSSATSPRLPCRHCHMTFVNEQGLGIHVKTMHSTANMYKGMRLRRMLGKGDGGRILPWEHAGPGHCWRVTFDHTTGGASFVLQPKRYKDVDLESDGFTVAAKATRGADTSE